MGYSSLGYKFRINQREEERRTVTVMGWVVVKVANAKQGLFWVVVVVVLSNNNLDAAVIVVGGVVVVIDFLLQ